MGRAERRAQMKNHKRDRRVETIGFEKVFGSLTEARNELAAIWPETDQYLDTPSGAAVLNYTLLGQSDAEFTTNMERIRGDGSLEAKIASVTDSKGQETLLAQTFVVKGAVCLTGWGKTSFGWEPVKGGYLAFVETWQGFVFKGVERVAAKALAMGWNRTLETPATRGQRRAGDVSHLQEFLAQGAAKHAASLEPQRIHAEGRPAAAGA
jgi:hypothetical protein